MTLLNRVRTRVSLMTTASYHAALGRITMYDSIYVSSLPNGAAAYAGYISGNWPTWGAMVARFANDADLLSIDPFASLTALAHCLDVESGDATNADILPWFRAMKSKGVSVPVIYTSAGNVQAVINILMGAGYERAQFLIWSAHYTFSAHICAPNVCGYPSADATQWSDSGPGGCDVSTVSSYFFPWTLGKSTPTPPADPTPVSVPTPVEDDDPMPVAIPPKTSPLQAVGVSFDGSPYTSIGFLGDPGVLGGGTVTVRVAMHNSKTNAYDVQTVSLTAAQPKVVLTVPASTDGVSFTRADDMNITLYPNFA